jgi:hypothetical protein
MFAIRYRSTLLQPGNVPPVEYSTQDVSRASSILLAEFSGQEYSTHGSRLYFRVFCPQDI